MSSSEMKPPSTGGIKSPDDYRDIKLASLFPVSEGMPTAFFNDVRKMPVFSQGALGACVGHAAAKYAQKLDQAETGNVPNLSPRFLYSLAKVVDGYAGEGTYPRTVASMWKRYGCATEATCPNDTNLDHETYVYNRSMGNMPQMAFSEAMPYAIGGYAFPELTEAGLKNAVLNTNGCMLLLNIGPEWYTKPDGSYSFDAADLLPLRKPKGSSSGHEVWLYGYDHSQDGRLRLWVFNSWGKQWALNGVGYLWYDEYKPYIQEAITAVDLPNDWQKYVHELPNQNTYRHQFGMKVTYGQKGDEVKALQTALHIEGVLKVDPGVFGYYGALTCKAVMDFQRKYQLAPEQDILKITGRYIGPKTIAQLNKIFNK